MKRARVSILYKSALFAEGIASILARQKTLNVEKLVKRSETTGKSVCLDKSDIAVVEGDSAIVAATGTLHSMLKRLAKVRVVGVDLEGNEVVVCMGVRLAATEENLIKAIAVPFFYCRGKTNRSIKRKEEKDEEGKKNI